MAVTATLRNKNTPAKATAPSAPQPTAPGLPADIEKTMDLPASSVQVIHEPEPDTETASSAPESASTAVATRTANQYTEDSDGSLQGDFDQEDLKLPQLKIVNGSGELSRKFNQGTLLLADEQLWEPPKLTAGATNPITHIIPVKIVKQFRENLTEDEMDDGVMPRIVNTREEAERAGGTTRWINNEKPRWAPSAKCFFLLQEPETCQHPAFSTVLDGKNYAACVYYAGGVAYNESARTIFNAAQINLKDSGRIMLFKKFWTFQVGKKQAGKFTVFVPVLKLTRTETGPELRELALSFGDVGNRAVETTAQE